MIGNVKVACVKILCTMASSLGHAVGANCSRHAADAGHKSQDRHSSPRRVSLPCRLLPFLLPRLNVDKQVPTLIPCILDLLVKSK